ncbi:MAG: hypothetical protein WD118_02310 [Phycisphaeraceae bacterium]
MPVYLLTIHAYRSWSEDNPHGYVQRGRGLQPSNSRRARWRRDHARFPPFRFDGAAQQLAHRCAPAICNERDLRLHACATTATHIHTLASFPSPACTCGAATHCHRDCPARRAVEAFLRRLKRKFGQQLAQLQAPSPPATTDGEAADPPTPARRRYLSRGWDVTPVRDRPHFRHLVTTYLPEHESQQNGIYRHYP